MNVYERMSADIRLTLPLEQTIRAAAPSLFRECSLPKYFFDFQDGDLIQPDKEGSDLSGFEEAREEAIALLPLVARERLPDGEHRKFIATVRDESGVALYRASLTFHGERLT